jgi:rRNA maturation endonuclease Nob1
MYLAKKGICVWLSSSLTFIVMVHLADAISVLFFNSQPHLLQLYPLIGDKLQAISPALYLTVSAVSTLIFWGITCGVAFDSPVEQFLNKVLSDAKKQSTLESQTVAEKGEVLDAMYETIEASNETLSRVVDIVHNVRTEVKGIQPLTLTVENIRTELSNLKREVKRIEEKGKLPFLCANCGKPVSLEFKLCPFCGENIKLSNEIAAVKAYR